MPLPSGHHKMCDIWSLTYCGQGTYFQCNESVICSLGDDLYTGVSEIGHNWNLYDYAHRDGFLWWFPVLCESRCGNHSHQEVGKTASTNNMIRQGALCWSKFMMIL